MEWNEVCEVFDGLYLNWDPSPFKQTRSFHGLARKAPFDIQCTISHSISFTQVLEA